MAAPIRGCALERPANRPIDRTPMQLRETDPRKLRVFHIGGYSRGPNDIVNQMRLGLEHAGSTVFEYDTDLHRDALDTDGVAYDRGTSGPVWLRWDRLREPLEEFAPHVVVCNAGGLSFRPDEATLLRKRSCLIGIALSDPDVFEPTTRHIAANFDVFLTNAPDCVPRYETLGVRAMLMPFGTNHAFFKPVPPLGEYRCEVLHLGRALPDRVEPVRALMENFDTHLYGERWDEYGIASRGVVYGDQLLAALNSAAVTVLFFLTPSGHPLVKVGLFDFAAAGALVATNRFSEVERYFSYGAEIIGFDTIEDMLETIRYHVDHPQQAALIRLAGRERVLREHSWRAIWTRLISSFGDDRSRRSRLAGALRGRTGGG
jgi:glycosyltransferase involved in cell wall biosynthesis